MYLCRQKTINIKMKGLDAFENRMCPAEKHEDDSYGEYKAEDEFLISTNYRNSCTKVTQWMIKHLLKNLFSTSLIADCLIKSVI